ncbi:MAG: outer membrane beta-barrel protein, partial [Dinghuibacter sp.]|nr:outer membrane beta-barrel protein [Dinghuibacter sp.]
PWWRLTATGLAGYVISKGGYANIPIDNRSEVVSVSANQSFTLSKKKGWSCTVIVTNTFPFTIVNTRVADRLETEVRLRKSAGPVSFTLSGTDFFRKNRDKYRVQANDLLIVQDFYYDLRSVALAISYNFGKATVKSKRDRDAEFEQVKGRIN